MGNMGDRRGGEASIILRLDLEQPTFHACDPAVTSAVTPGDARQHLLPGPAFEQAVCGLPAKQLLVGDVHPVECLLSRYPDRALASGILCVDDEFGLAGHRVSLVVMAEDGRASRMDRRRRRPR